MLRLLATAAESLRQARRIGRALELTPREMKRFRRKTRNLAWCYLAFGEDRSFRSVKRSVIAAVSCAAYDVMTDWRGFSASNQRRLGELLRTLVGAELAAIAVDLYEKEQRGEVRDDGLERGWHAIVFVTEILGSKVRIERGFDLKRLGMACQVVDDVLDYHEDLAAGELNCLTSPRWRQHIEFMRAELSGDRMREMFSKSVVFRWAVRHAISRGQLFLANGLPKTPRSVEHRCCIATTAPVDLEEATTSHE